MARCGYKTQVLDEEWECPLDALTGERYCYWHKEEDGKEPTEEQLEELKGKEVRGVYLRVANLQNANLCGVNLQNTNLEYAKLQGSRLVGVNLQNTNLKYANLRGSDVDSAHLQKADLRFANLQKTNLRYAELQESKLYRTKLQESDLRGANLQKADLRFANLRGTYLDDAKIEETLLDKANFQKANLQGLNLREANLLRVNFHETRLCEANLQGANFYGAMFDSKTDLDGSIFIGANLYRSYFDEAKSFRNATVFRKEDDREINEIIGDSLACRFIRILESDNKYPIKIISKIISFILNKILNKKLQIHLPLKPAVFDMDMIEKKAPGVAAKLHGNGLIRYARVANKIIFFDWQSRCAIKNPENTRRDERSFIRVEKLTNLLLKDSKIQSDFLYKGSRASHYEASYEVYNNLYNFYTANGRLDQAAHVHYRRGEVHRKFRWARGGWKNRARSIFDLVILNLFTGYGDKISRPITVSSLIIGLFAALFWLSDGIVKNVNGTQVAPDWIDYLYHSITTFTSLGYSNIQPNLAVGHLPQVLVAFESGLGVLMMALIIFVVTYQVSR